MSRLPDTAFWNIKQAAAYLGVHPTTLGVFLRGKSNHHKGPKLKGPPPPSINFKDKGPAPHRRVSNKLVLIPIEEFKAWANGKKENGFV